MTSTPPDQAISDSWVDLTGQASPVMSRTPVRITPIPFGGEQDYLRMLREAQHESNWSSTKVSPISSAIMSLASTGRNTPSLLPKSPPNSPNPELATLVDELKDVYINRMAASQEADLVFDWSSRPNIPFKDSKYPARSRNISSSSQPTSHNSRLQHYSHHSSQHWMHDEKQFSDPQVASSPKPQRKKKRVIFTKEVIYTLLITNLLSIILGAGLGVWLSKRGGGGHNAKILVPITASSLL